MESNERKKSQPIRIRQNPLAREDKKWYQLWKKQGEFGKQIKLTKQQLKEAIALNDSGQDIILKIFEENYKTIPEPESIQPLLFLMKENGYTEVLENVKTGEFIIQTPKGEKSCWLTPDKLTTLKIGDMYYKAWIQYENCLTPYPEDPIYSSELIRKLVQKIALNYHDLNEAALLNAKTKMWLWIIGGVVIAIVLLLSTDFGQGLVAALAAWGKSEGATQAANVATSAATATTEAVKNTGVTVG